MDHTKLLNLNKDVKGRAVISRANGLILGQVVDLIVQPQNGQVYGLTVSDAEGQEHFLAWNETEISAEAVLTNNTDLPGSTSTLNWPEAVRVCNEVLGAKVVTETGDLLGSVTDIHLFGHSYRAFYYVTPAALRKLFRNGFLLPSDGMRAYTREIEQNCCRLIVPANVNSVSISPSKISSLAALYE